MTTSHRLRARPRLAAPSPMFPIEPNATSCSEHWRWTANRGRARSYDLVVIEAPPIGAVVDYKMIAGTGAVSSSSSSGETSQRLVLECFF